MHRFRALLIVSLMSIALATCAGNDERSRSNSDETVVVDALGDTVRFATAPRRIVSLAPNLTELVFAIGAGDRLVGVTEFCDYPPEAKGIPPVSGFSIVNLETLVATNPDLIIANRGNQPQDLATLRRMGYQVFAFRIDSLGMLLDAARTLGTILDVSGAADSVAESWRFRIDAVERSVLAQTQTRRRPRVFFGGMQEPVYTVGSSGYISDLVTRAGGSNVFDDLPAAWPRIDLETLVARDPEIMVIGFHSGLTNREETIRHLRGMPGWRTLQAVQTNRVYTVGDEIMRPGPRLIDVLETLHRAFYENAELPN